jgi:tRNA modification GTPase
MTARDQQFGTDTPRPLATILTPRGRGAVATIAYFGNPARLDQARLFQAANRKPLAEQPIARVVFGRWGAEDVVVCRTGPDRLEISCHGGEVATRRIMENLVSQGIARCDWAEFLEQTEGSFAADVANALAAASTPRCAAIIVKQSEGPLRVALAELAAADLQRHSGEVVAQLDRVLRWADFGIHLTEPWRVVLYGRPNVGKSSLINALVGFARAIVFDRPGTTRDVVTAETAFAGWPITLCDTAGLRAEADELEAAGIARAQAALANADLRVLVLDRSEARPRDGESLRESAIPHGLPAYDLVVANKCDLPNAWGEASPQEAIPVSAMTGAGIRELATRIAAALVPHIPAEHEPVPISRAQVERLRQARDAAKAGDSSRFRHAMGVY